MKRLFTLTSLLFVFNLSFAQTTLTTAVDFTVTDVHGNEFTLQETLDAGKHVIVDFFFTTCGPCIASVPTMNESFEKYGCNKGDIFYLSVDAGDTNAEVLQYEEDYGGLFPAVSGTEGGGDAVVADYGITAFPTVILIAPNGDILSQDIFPVTHDNLDGAINGTAGIDENPEACSIVGTQELIANATTKINHTAPNPASYNATLSLVVSEASAISVKVTDLLGREVAFINAENFTIGNHTIDLPVADLANGTYIVNLYQNGTIADVSKLSIAK